MNGTEFLADTNAIIYLLKGNECMRPYLKTRIAVSVISFMELLSFPGITEQEEKNIRSFIDLCELHSLNDSIMEQTIRLRRQYRIKLPDAIIAATSIYNDLPLITADMGFINVDGLRVVRLTPS